MQRAAGAAGLVFGVDLAARDTATVGGMASTNAGGLRTVRYGNMGEQVIGLQVALPDGSLLRRHSRVRRDNTGYDLSALFVGAEGTLGVITALDLRLHPTPSRRVTAICGFADLEALVEAGRTFRDVDGIAALELIDGRAAALTREHLGVGSPVEGDWLLLVELAADHDQTERLADLLDGARLCGEPAVGVDVAAQQRLWQVRESLAEVLGVYGPPLKFDVSLPLSSVDGFAREATDLIGAQVPEALPVLFGHIGEGNLHLNVLRCPVDRERAVYAPMMDLIARCGGNVSSEHGVGSAQAALPRHVTRARGHRGDADGQSRLGPDRVPQRRGAVRVAAIARAAKPAKRVAAIRPISAALDSDRVPQLRQELVGVVASDDVVRYRNPDHRRRLHRGVGPGQVTLQAVAHLRDDPRELGDGVLGFDIDHAHTGVRMLVLDDEPQHGVELVDPLQPGGRPDQAALEDLSLVARKGRQQLLFGSEPAVEGGT